MKIKLWTVIIISTAALALNAQTNDLTALLQQGLFEEQANRNLDSAIAVYQNLALQFDKDRQLAATAVFRLGECYRAKGRTNEAAAQYQRILRDFSDQQTLVTLSRQDLAAMGVNGAATPPAEQALAASFDLQLWNKLRDMPEAELEKTLPTVVSDTALDGLLKQRYEAQAKLVQLRTDYSESNAVCVQQKALLTEFNRQVADRISGIMQGLKIRAEVAQASGSTGSPENSGKPASAGENDEDKEIQRIQRMIQNSPDLINAASDGSTPLVKAAFNGWLKVADYLLVHGADVNTPAPYVRLTEEMPYAPATPLAAAVMAGNKAMTEFLIGHGADVNCKVRDNTLLHLAAKNGFQVVAEVLLANHANVDARNQHDTTPLFFAAQSGQLKLVQMLLAAGADVKAKDVDGWTVLNYAMGNSPEIFKALLEAGADPNTEDVGFSRTPLSYAVQRGNQEVIKLLLAAGADPNGGSDTPLLRAIQENSLASAELLLRAGANPNLKAEAGRVVDMGPGQLSKLTPIFSAVQTKQPALVQLLLKFKADPNDSQTDGKPLLFRSLDQQEILKILIAAGANVDARAPGGGFTPLGAAVNVKNLSAVQVLLNSKADPDADQGWASPAVFAALPDTNILQALLNAGANIESHDRTIDVNGDDPNWTPLAAAAWQRSPAAVNILLKHGANPNAIDAVGNTPLHWAVYFTWVTLNAQNQQIVAILLNHGVNPNVRNQAGYTALDWVKRRLGQNQNTEDKAAAIAIVDLLHQHGALDKLPDWDSITISRPSSNISFKIFQRGTNDWNRFSLLEAIFNSYASSIMYPVQRNGMTTLVPLAGMLPFPDLRHVLISRPSHTSTNESHQVINLLNETNDIDVTKDIPLEFGDVVEIHERDHALGESNGGLTDNQTSALAEYLKGSVQLVAHGQKVNISIRRYGDRATLNAVLSSPEGQILLRVSSDLSRIKVTRAHPKEGEKREWIVDFNQTRARNGNQFAPLAFSTRSEVAPPDALWLRDGDVISVPEKF